MNRETLIIELRKRHSRRNKNDSDKKNVEYSFNVFCHKKVPFRHSNLRQIFVIVLAPEAILKV